MKDLEWQRVGAALPRRMRRRLRERPDEYRAFVEGVFWVCTSNASWHELPSHLGTTAAVYARFRRWSREGFWEIVVDAISPGSSAELRSSLALRGGMDCVHALSAADYAAEVSPLPRPVAAPAIIRSTLAHAGHSLAPVLRTVFKKKKVFVAWGIGSLESAGAAEPLETSVARTALLEVAGSAQATQLHDVVISTQFAVAVTVHAALSDARPGDAVLFLCECQDVVDWLMPVLAIDVDQTERESVPRRVCDALCGTE